MPETCDRLRALEYNDTVPAILPMSGLASCGPTILIVEDNEPLTCKLLNDILVFTGTRFLPCAPWRRGHSTARRHMPNLNYTRCQLPDFSGAGSRSSAQADEQTRAIPIIEITLFALQGDEAPRLIARAGGDRKLIMFLTAQCRRICRDGCALHEAGGAVSRSGLRSVNPTATS